MKFILLLFLIPNLSFSQNETWEGSTDDTTRVLKVFNWMNKVKFNDTITKEYEYLPKGKISENQKWIIYFDNKKTKKTAERFFENNHEYRIQYFPSGQKQFETIYTIPIDYVKMQHYAWYENGVHKIERISKQNSDTSIDKYFYPSGNLLELDLSIGPAWIYGERWCDNGQLINKGLINSQDKMEVIHYHCNGKMKAKFYLMNGTLVGKWQDWYETGQLKTDGQYKEMTHDPNTFPPSEEIRKWSYYNRQLS